MNVMDGTLVRSAARALDKLADVVGQEAKTAAHIATGQAGEDAAYFHLRKLGYVMVARNWRVPQCKGELDLVAWDGDVLCFIEVKTRSTRDVKPAEAAVDRPKQEELLGTAREYLRRLKRTPPYRFDIVSIYVEKPGQAAELHLLKSAFSGVS